MEQQGEFIFDRNKKLKPDEEFHHHTGDKWDEIAEKEMRPAEHKLGLEKKSEPVDLETAREYFKKAWDHIENGPKKETYQIPPHEPVNDMDRYAMEEREREKREVRR